MDTANFLTTAFFVVAFFPVAALILIAGVTLVMKSNAPAPNEIERVHRRRRVRELEDLEMRTHDRLNDRVEAEMEALFQQAGQ